MLKIHSIYESISGEVSEIPQGSFVTIVRLSGCNLQCSYCDAIDAREGVGQNYSVDQVVEMVRSFGNKNILITGGEPLLQEDELNYLIVKLLLRSDKPYNFIIETNGTINPSNTKLFDNASFVMDYKMPMSGCYTDMKIENFLDLKRWDIIKFVCDSEYDIRVAIDIKNILRKRGCVAQMAIGQTWLWFQTSDLNLVKYLIGKKEKGFIINFQLHKLLGVE